MVQKPRKTIDKALPALAERQRDLLRAVIREYIATAEPVASAALVRRYGLDVSSATVRNALAAVADDTQQQPFAADLGAARADLDGEGAAVLASVPGGKRSSGA